MRTISRTLNIYAEDYETLNKLKITPTETYDNVITRILNEVEENGKKSH